MKLTSIRKNYLDCIDILINLGMDKRNNEFTKNEIQFLDNKILAENLLNGLLGKNEISFLLIKGLMLDKSFGLGVSESEINSIIKFASVSTKNFDLLVDSIAKQFEEDSYGDVRQFLKHDMGDSNRENVSERITINFTAKKYGITLETIFAKRGNFLLPNLIKIDAEMDTYLSLEKLTKKYVSDGDTSLMLLITLMVNEVSEIDLQSFLLNDTSELINEELKKLLLDDLKVRSDNRNKILNDEFGVKQNVTENNTALQPNVDKLVLLENVLFEIIKKSKTVSQAKTLVRNKLYDYNTTITKLFRDKYLKLFGLKVEDSEMIIEKLFSIHNTASQPNVEDSRYNIVNIVGEANQYVDYSHIAIHKPTNAIAWFYDYADLYAKAPKEPIDKTDKKAVVKYKTKLSDWKYNVTEKNKEINEDKQVYFYQDLIDNIKPNFNNEKDFKLSDFTIVTKNNFSKMNIDLDNFKSFIGENNGVGFITDNPAFVEPTYEKEVSEDGRIYVDVEFETYEVFNNKGGSPIQETKRNICRSVDSVIIGYKSENINDGIYYNINTMSGKFYRNLNDAGNAFFNIVDLSMDLENDMIRICAEFPDYNQAFPEMSKLQYPSEVRKHFFTKYFGIYGVETMGEVAEEFHSIHKDYVAPVEEPAQQIFETENAFPYGITTSGEKIQFSESDIVDGVLVARNKDLAEFIAPFKFNMNLDVSQNELHKLELLGDFNGSLDCFFNHLKTLKLPFGYNNYINCSGNMLSELELSSSFNNELNISMNEFKFLDLSHMKSFNSPLICGENEIENIILPDGYNAFLDASKNKMKTYVVKDGFNSYLDVSNNELTSLTFEGFFDAKLDCSNNKLVDLKLPEGYDMKNLTAVGNISKVSEDVFTFMQDKPLMRTKALATLEKLVRYDGKVSKFYELIESLDRGLSIEISKMYSKTSTKGYVEKLTIGDMVTSYKVESEYYKYLENGGKPYSLEIEKIKRENIEAERLKKIADDEAYEIRNKERIEEDLKHKEVEKQNFIAYLSTNNVGELVDKYTAKYKSEILQLGLERKSKSRDEQIEWNNRMILQLTETITKSYNNINQIYELINGEPVRKFVYEVGEVVVVIDDRFDPIKRSETIIETVYTRPNNNKSSYTVQKINGIFNAYVEYESLRKVDGVGDNSVEEVVQEKSKIDAKNVDSINIPKFRKEGLLNLLNADDLDLLISEANEEDILKYHKLKEIKKPNRDTKDDLVFYERKLRATKSLITENYELAHSMYQIVNGEPIRKYTFEIGDVVVYKHNNKKVETTVVEIVEFYGEQVYILDVTKNLSTKNVAYDDLRPLDLNKKPNFSATKVEDEDDENLDFL